MSSSETEESPEGTGEESAEESAEPRMDAATQRTQIIGLLELILDELQEGGDGGA